MKLVWTECWGRRKVWDVLLMKLVW